MVSRSAASDRSPTTFALLDEGDQFAEDRGDIAPVDFVDDQDVGDVGLSYSLIAGVAEYALTQLVARLALDNPRPGFRRCQRHFFD